MLCISSTDVRGKMAEMIDQVRNDNAPITITRQGVGAAVLISLEEYESMEETAHLLRSPKNAQRLLAAIVELAGQGGTEKELIDCD